MVLLLASGLAIDNLAARSNGLLPLVWLHAVAPGLLCAWLLFGPQWRSSRRQLLAPT
jgi:lipopolysaccharide export system permease protein